ncbi:MAG: diguanylate cyclase [Pseudonocardia sp.]|nr:diguanylate cyclase [Pseudonocardia sp.]
MSIGGATFPEDADHLLDLVEIADTALYKAERNGRDAVRMGVPS